MRAGPISCLLWCDAGHEGGLRVPLGQASRASSSIPIAAPSTHHCSLIAHTLSQLPPCNISRNCSPSEAPSSISAHLHTLPTSTRSYWRCGMLARAPGGRASARPPPPQALGTSCRRLRAAPSLIPTICRHSRSSAPKTARVSQCLKCGTNSAPARGQTETTRQLTRPHLPLTSAAGRRYLGPRCRQPSIHPTH